RYSTGLSGDGAGTGGFSAGQAMGRIKTQLTRWYSLSWQNPRIAKCLGQFWPFPQWLMHGPSLRKATCSIDACTNTDHCRSTALCSGPSIGARSLSALGYYAALLSRLDNQTESPHPVKLEAVHTDRLKPVAIVLPASFSNCMLAVAVKVC